MQNGTICQTDLDVETAKLLKRPKMWPMVTVGPWPAENSKTFGLTPVGVRFPLPAPTGSCSQVPGPAAVGRARAHGAEAMSPLS